MPDFLRFHRLGFECNPFRVLTNEEWATLSVVPSRVLEIIETTNHHVQVSGDMGRGKTTLLLGIGRYLRQKGVNMAYEYIPEGQRHFKTQELPDVFLLDEVQRLNWWERRCLFREVKRGSRLIFSTHKDLYRAFHHHEIKLECVDVNSLYDKQLLFEMWQRRLDYFRTGSTDIVIAMVGIEYLIELFGDDRRSMERFLYEAFQSLETPHVLDRQYLSEFRNSLHSEQV